MKLDLTGPAYMASKQDMTSLSRQGPASREIIRTPEGLAAWEPSWPMDPA